MRTANIMRAGAALLLPLAMAACSDRSGGDTPQAVPPPGVIPPTASIQSQIGAAFASFFDASNATDAKDPTPADLPPVSLTTEPIPG